MYTKKLIAKEQFYNNNSYYPVFTIVNVIRLCNSFLFLNNTQFVIYTYLYSLMNNYTHQFNSYFIYLVYMKVWIIYKIFPPNTKHITWIAIYIIEP